MSEPPELDVLRRASVGRRHDQIGFVHGVHDARHRILREAWRERFRRRGSVRAEGRHSLGRQLMRDKRTVGDLLREVGRWEGESGAELDALFTRQPGNRSAPELP